MKEALTDPAAVTVAPFSAQDTSLMFDMTIVVNDDGITLRDVLIQALNNGGYPSPSTIELTIVLAGLVRDTRRMPFHAPCPPYQR